MTALKIEPPFLELGFYCAASPSRCSVVRIVESLDQGVAKPTGRVLVHDVSDPRETATFAAINDLPLVELNSVEPGHIYSVATNPNYRVVQVEVIGSSLPGSTAGLVTYVSISVEAQRHDHHPVALWLSDESIDGVLSNAMERLFIDLTLRIRPTYAAASHSWGLECLFDLDQDPRSLAFQDFFIDTRLLGTAAVRQIREICSGARFIEEDAGLFVFLLSRPGKRLAVSTRLECARLTGELLARVLGPRSN
jgi:hypothetical protein